MILSNLCHIQRAFLTALVLSNIIAPMAFAQDGRGITIHISGGTIATSDDGSVPGVVFASGTAHCSGGTYNNVGTGNNKGGCKPTGSDENNNSTGYACDDGEGNSVVIDCAFNGGKGICTSTGSGTCGKFTTK